jgi:starvation-inducible DNA-binding protein
MDEQTDAVRALVDEVAERITTLGAVTAGLPSQVVEERTSDADYALGRGPVMAHLGALDKVYERVISGHRDAISAVEQTDPVSEEPAYQPDRHTRPPTLVRESTPLRH